MINRKISQWILTTVVVVIFFPFSQSLAQVSPSAETEQEIIQRLEQRARQYGSARVIMQLDVSNLSESDNSRFAINEEQRRAISRVQNRIINRLTSGAVNKPVRYRHIPYIAMELDAEDIATIKNDADIISIQEDSLSAPLLADSTTLIGATDAWSLGRTGSGQVVAVLDTGVDIDHPFLAGKVIHQACFSSNNSFWDSETVCPNGLEIQIGGNAADVCSGISGCSHGTHVAGIVAGESAGFSGVARGADIIAIQVFSRFTGSVCTDQGVSSPCLLTFTSDQLSGLDYIYQQRNNFNIASINMSVGGGRFTDVCDSDPRKTAIDLLRVSGIATVIASGNDGFSDAVSSPACISTAITVGSTTKSDLVSSFSNSATMIDLLAPGSSIRSSVPGSGFAFFSGTSMATPHVAGAFAVLKATTSGASVDQIMNALSSTGVMLLDNKNGISKPRIAVDDASDNLIAAVGGGVLDVSPADGFLTAGAELGPFTPATKEYTLTNIGDASMNYTVSENVNWISVSPVSGTLAQGASVTVTVSVDSGANALTAGTYVSIINFTNTTNGLGNTSRTLTLNISELVASNDKFVDAITLFNSSGSTTGINLNATKESGEPVHAGKTGGNSVWWQWTAPASGTVEFNTIGSNFDTLLGIYTGNGVANLTEIASDNDSAGSQSSTNFTAIAGQTYFIAVDGFNTATGTIILNWSLLLGSSIPGGISVSPESGFDVAGPVGGPFSPTSINYTITNVSSSIQSFTVDDVPSWLTTSALGGNLAPDQSITITLAVNTTANSLPPGDLDATIKFNTIERPASLSVTSNAATNDDFVNAIDLGNSSTSTTGFNVGASKETNEPDHAGNTGGRSVWWQWTAPSTAQVEMDTFGSLFDTTIAVYTGTQVDALTPVVANDDDNNGTQSRVFFNATAGTTYSIGVDGFNGDSGTINLNIISDVIRVPNDFSTIQGAINSAIEGDTVLIETGIYFETIDFLGKGITVKSVNGPEETIIDGDGGDFVVKVDTDTNHELLILDGVTIRNGEVGIFIQRTNKNINILNNIFKNFNIGDGGIILINSSSSLSLEKLNIKGNLVRDNVCDLNVGDPFSAATIRLFESVHNVNVENNVIINNKCSGMNLVNNDEENNNIHVINNTVGNNSGAGIYTSNSRPKTIRNNIVINNKRGFYLWSGWLIFNEPEKIIFEDNLFYNNDINYENYTEQTNINGNISIDPKVASSSIGDFRLNPDSPAIDAGASTGAPTDDFDGNPRPVDGDGNSSALVDIGAYEYSPNPGSLTFDELTFSTNENSGTAIISVSRVAGNIGAVSIDYATVNGTATAGEDYHPASGRISFANGEIGTKTFTVEIVDDGNFEGDETVQLVLTNPQGGADLGVSTTSTLTIENSPLLSSDYFPLTSGLSRTYIVDGFFEYSEKASYDVTEVNDVATTAFEDQFGDRRYYSNNGNGLFIHRDDIYDPELDVTDIFTFTPGIKLTNTTMTIGDSISTTGTLTLDLIDVGTFLLNYQVISNVEAVETISVPGGTYEAIRLKVTTRIIDSSIGLDTTQEEFYWLAKGIGTIKLSRSVDGSPPTIFELTEFTSPKGDDLIMDLGDGIGVSAWMNNDQLIQLHEFTTFHMATGDLDGNGQADVVIDFGPAWGVWAWMNNSSWIHLHTFTSEGMTTGDLDGNGQSDALVDFGPAWGVWVWLNNSNWIQLHTFTSEGMTAGDLDGNGQADALIDFGPAWGVWGWMNNNNWIQLHTFTSEGMTAGDLDGNGQADALIDFSPAWGVWAWMNNNNWIQLHAFTSEGMTTGDLDGNGQDDAQIDFGPAWGVWAWMNNNNWIQLHAFTSEGMTTGDLDGNGQSDALFDFGPDWGVWGWINNRNWIQVHPESSTNMITGNLDGN